MSFSHYEVKVVAVNANGASVETVAAQSKTLEDNAPVSPPTLLSATFTSLAQGIELTFDSMTDKGIARVGGGGGGGESSSANGCEELLSFPGMASASCSWLSKSKLLITLGIGSSILPGDLMTVNGETLKAECTLKTSNCPDWLHSPEQTLAVQAPANALSPSVVLAGPSAIGICDNLTINSGSSSGSGGREFTNYNWTLMVVGDASADDKVAARAALATSDGLQKLFVVGTWLSAGGTFRIRLELTNFLGVTSSAEVMVTKLSLPVPMVEIDGGSFHNAYRSTGLELNAVASAPSCVELGSMRIVYSWTIGGQSVDGYNTATSPTKLMLPSLNQYLVAGETNAITVTVLDTNGGSNTAIGSLNVLSSPLVGVIGGGDRSVGFDNGLALDASPSLDPDNETAPMQYSWSCQPIGSTAVDCGSAAIAAAAAASEGLGSAQLVVPGGALTAESEFLWEVRVSKDSRVASTGVTISVVAGNPVQIGIDGSCCSTKVNPSQKVTIQATVATGSMAVSASTEWTQELGDLAFGEGDLSTPLLNSAALVINAGMLTPGAQYTFKLTGEAPGRAPGASQITLIVNAPPTSGSLAIEPPSGTVLDTQFSFEALQWVDEDAPLKYRFGYVDPALHTNKFVVAAQLNTLTEGILLPQGGGANSTLVAFVVVLDSLGASVQSNTIVTVNELVLTTAELSAKTDELLSSALDTQDASGVFQAIGAIGAMINVDTSAAGADEDVDPCEFAPDCASLDREECVAHSRCGVCNAGLVPTIGAGANNTDACVAPLPVCSNTFEDDTETDVDCGGGAHTGAMTQAEMCPACAEGLNCLIDSDCEEPLVCTADQKCSKPLKECPVYSDAQCSALGQCQHASVTGIVLDASVRCTIDRMDCEAQCSCDDGRYGIGCQMDEEEYQQMVALRESMLNALLSTEGTTEKSPDDLAQQASFVTLLTAVPSELSATSQDAVLGMMGRLASGSSEGGMVEGMDNDVATALGDLLDTDLLNRTARRRRLGGTDAGDAIGQTLYELSQGSLVGSVDGEAAKVITTKNIQMTSQKLGDTTSGMASGAFEVPAGALDIGSSVNSQSTSFTKSPHVGGTPSGFSGLQSAVVGLKFSDATGEIAVNNLSTPIMLVVPNTMPKDYSGGTKVLATFNHTCFAGLAEEIVWECPGGNNKSVSIKCDLPWWSTLRESAESRTCLSATVAACTYWDVETAGWSDEGCTAVSFTAENTTCACTHLTDFGAASKGMATEALAVLSQDPRDLFNPATMLKNIAVFAVVFSIFGICLGLIFCGWRKDRKDMRALVPELKSGEKENLAMAVEKGALLAGGLISGLEGEHPISLRVGQAAGAANDAIVSGAAAAGKELNAAKDATGKALGALDNATGGYFTPNNFLQATQKHVLTARDKTRQRFTALETKFEDLAGKSATELSRAEQKWLAKKKAWIARTRARFQAEDARAKKRLNEGIPLPYLFQSAWELFRRQVKEKHKLLSVHWVFLPSFTRPQRLLMVWVNIMGVMTANALLYDIKNPTVDCAAYSTDWDLHIRGNESVCVAQMDLLQNPMCEWDGNPENEECLYLAATLAQVIAAAIISGITAAICTAPIDIVLGMGFKKVSPSRKVRKAMKQFDDDINSTMSFETACREHSMTKGRSTEALTKDKLMKDREEMSKAERKKLDKEQQPMYKPSINEQAVKVIAAQDERYKEAGRRPPNMVKKKGKSKKVAKIYAAADLEAAGDDDDEYELQECKAAPPFWKRCLMCRRKLTPGEKRWSKAVAAVTKERALEVELRKLTEKQRAARILEMARVQSMSPLVKIMYGLNSLPFKRIDTPLPYCFKYIFYLIGFGYVFFCGYFLLGFGVRRGADITEAWLVSMISTLITTMCISWPATVFFMNVLLPKMIEPIISKVDVAQLKGIVAQHAGDLHGQVELAIGLQGHDDEDGGDGQNGSMFNDGSMLGSMMGMAGGMAGAGAALGAFGGNKAKKKNPTGEDEEGPVGNKWKSVRTKVTGFGAPLEASQTSSGVMRPWGASAYASTSASAKLQGAAGQEYAQDEVFLGRQVDVDTRYRAQVRELESSDERWRFGVKVLRKIMRVWATDTCGRLLGNTEDAQWSMIREKVEPQGREALWRAWKNLAEQKLFSWLSDAAEEKARQAREELARQVAKAESSRDKVVPMQPIVPVDTMPVRWVHGPVEPTTVTSAQERLRRTADAAPKVKTFVVGMSEQDLHALILEYLVEREDAVAEYMLWQKELESEQEPGTPRKVVVKQQPPKTPRVKKADGSYDFNLPSDLLNSPSRNEDRSGGDSGGVGLLGAGHRRLAEDEELREQIQAMWETRLAANRAEDESAKAKDKSMAQDTGLTTAAGRTMMRGQRQGWQCNPWNGSTIDENGKVRPLPPQESPLMPEWVLAWGGSEAAAGWLRRAHGGDKPPTDEEQSKAVEDMLLKKARQMFEDMDLDTNGSITKAEQEEFYRRSGVDLDNPGMQEMMQAQFDKVDSNHDGSISVEEFEKVQLPLMRKQVDDAKEPDLEEEKLDEEDKLDPDVVGWDELPVASQRWVQAALKEAWAADPWTSRELDVQTMQRMYYKANAGGMGLEGRGDLMTMTPEERQSHVMHLEHQAHGSGHSGGSSKRGGEVAVAV
jgi:hypothetical protein